MNNLRQILNSNKRFLGTSLLVGALTVNPFLTENVQSQDLEGNIATSTAETAPEVEWIKTFGGSDYDRALSVKQNSDKGYIVAGITSSFGAGNFDAWLIKTDPNGNKEWDKTFGGSNYDFAYSIQQTSDGSYIAAGITGSFGAGNYDVWLIKTDPNGNKEWDKTFGGYDQDRAHSVKLTSDGDYIIAGDSESFGAGKSDFWLIKTDPNGNKEWDKTFGGSGSDKSYSVQQTFDGGYILAGYTESFGAGKTDFWLIKTDPNGNKEWDKTFGGSGRDCALSVQQTFDGDYILAGYTESLGAGNFDAWLIKTDPNGNKEWDKTFGGSDHDRAYSVQQTFDEGYIVAGITESLGAGNFDAWLIKTDPIGNKEWDKTFGGSNHDHASSVQQTSDGSYIAAGETSSFGAGNGDAWLIKLKGNREQPDLAITTLQAYTDEPGQFPIAGEDSFIRLVIKNIGNQTWQGRELIALVNVVDMYNTIPNGFWTKIWKNDTIRQSKHIRLGILPNIAPGESLEKILNFRFTAPDFSDQLYVQLLPGKKGENIDEWQSNNSRRLTPFFVRFNNEAYINCLGEILTGLSHGVINSSELQYAQIAYDAALEGKELIVDITDLRDALSSENPEDVARAGELTWKYFNEMSEKVYKKGGKELAKEIIPFVDAAWNEFNGTGCGAAIGHSIIYNFVKGKSKVMAKYNNIVTVIAASPSDIILEKNGNITSIDQYGNAKSGIEHSIAYLSGPIKVVQVPESEENYSLTLKGTAKGTTDVVIVQPKTDAITQQQTVEIVVYENISTTEESVASRDIGKVVDETLKVDVDNDGKTDEYKQPDSVEEDIVTMLEEDQPKAYSLLQNYPNPFNLSTLIQYSILEPSQVKITIYNIQGQEVTTIVQGYQPPGGYSVEWDGKGLYSGIYIYRLQTNNFTQTRKMLLLK